MSETLLTAATGASNSNPVAVKDGAKATLILYATNGLEADEYGDIQISHDGGTTFQDLYVDGSQIRLNSTNVAQTVYGPGIFLVAKEATTEAAGIYVSIGRNL